MNKEEQMDCCRCWDKLYGWLNDMHFAISPDETTPDDERGDRQAQADIIEVIMGWIEANIFEQRAESEEQE